MWCHEGDSPGDQRRLRQQPRHRAALDVMLVFQLGPLRELMARRFAAIPPEERKGCRCRRETTSANPLLTIDHWSYLHITATVRLAKLESTYKNHCWLDALHHHVAMPQALMEEGKGNWVKVRGMTPQNGRVIV